MTSIIESITENSLFNNPLIFNGINIAKSLFPMKKFIMKTRKKYKIIVRQIGKVFVIESGSRIALSLGEIVGAKKLFLFYFGILKEEKGCYVFVKDFGINSLRMAKEMVLDNNDFGTWKEILY